MVAVTNIVIERGTNYGVKFKCNLDFTGWTLVYVVKKSKTDKDTVALIYKTPTQVEEDGVIKIVLEFTPTDTKKLNIISYVHAMRAISANGETEIPVFNGVLVIKNDNCVDGTGLSNE